MKKNINISFGLLFIISISFNSLNAQTKEREADKVIYTEVEVKDTSKGKVGKNNKMPQNDTMMKYFRTTSLHKSKVTLQANIETLKDIAIKDPDNYYHFKKGSYGVADSIWTEVNNTKQIIAIYFAYNYEPEYSNDTAYIHELRKYTRIINSKGREYVYNSVNSNIKVTKWEDHATRFELIELTQNGKKKVYSVIFDNELYFKKLKGRIDLRKNDNSIELLKRLGF